ncbi:MAG: hypothetical protein MJ170_04360, partial [Alphaproteobacteria bacterium]|nr:hypothetical protein [Alphaproteobacteria bacterium]
MIKNRFLGLIAGLFAVTPVVVHAAYPVNQARTVAAASNGNVVYLPTNTNGVVAANANTAAAPTRVTGALPRVGTTATNAGRQYYQSADYERLADSGLYIGLSAAYTASTFGKISADYTGQGYAGVMIDLIAEDVPGAFKEASWKHDTVIPLQVSLGAAINSNLRVDFSYLRYSGLSYPSNVETGNGVGGFTTATASGGAITANTAMLNVYYNIDSFTGYIAGGSLRPYIGAGVGLSLNTIADYVVYDSGPYGFEEPSCDSTGCLTSIENILGYHNGGTNEQLAFGFELGLTTDLSGGIKLDFFGRYVNLGKV